MGRAGITQCGDVVAFRPHDDGGARACRRAAEVIKGRSVSSEQMILLNCSPTLGQV